MTVHVRLVVTCDAPGCQARVVFPGDDLGLDLAYEASVLAEGQGWTRSSYRRGHRCPRCSAG